MPDQRPADGEELKPCPFCGGTASALKRNCEKDTPYNPADRAFPVVRCTACFAEAAGADWTAPRTAIAAWNRRAQAVPAPTAPKVEEVMALVSDLGELEFIRGQDNRGTGPTYAAVAEKFAAIRAALETLAAPSAAQSESRSTASPDEKDATQGEKK